MRTILSLIPKNQTGLFFSILESKKPSKCQLVEKFDNKVWGDNEDDAVKFAILFYIYSFIISEEPTTIVIDRKDFDLVESGRYIDYPWGKKAFDLLILHLHTKIKHDGKYFRLFGFPLALQVWFYECCSNFDEEITVKVCDHIPRILNWKTKKDFPRLSYFAKGMFRDDNNPVRTVQLYV
uniref:Ulp1 protease family, C-terminal catalytic domain containing protein n=1 Tax=Solanum tuberosum TaxID=4113 RepID=M1A7B3_SOLTU